MREIELNAEDEVHELIHKLNASLKGEVSNYNEEYSLKLNNEIGKGLIRYIGFKGGISLLEYDVEFYDDIVLKINTSVLSPLYFIYCLNGDLKQRFYDKSKWISVDDYQSIILSATSKGMELCLSANKLLQFNIFKLHREKYLNHRGYLDFIDDPLKELFLNENAEEFSYRGTYNLKIAEQIKHLKTIEKDGLISKFLIESQINLILALQIKQFRDDLQNEFPQNPLSKRELAKAQELAEYIDDNVGLPHTIESLTQRAGIPAAKLQSAFRYLYDRTVIDYIKNVRIEKAEELIKTTDFSISEIVYSVGFTSRSYFSKIFKNKYNTTPKAYQKKVRGTS
ncbi:helix-turn-helix domain-containing protein [Leeuwenhoekiella sp. A16]|uniref:helix-turn-helix domain-containing protein n=1 Tax=unclassified Leeuwenhoekiella TaxID=2615029 RepID=UPI003A80DBD6